jgi:mannose-6-phosphate isomerase-like protein (cupin superfamily)
MTNYMIAQLDEIDPLRCPCGFTRRAFAAPENSLATVHQVDIQEDAQTHYHKKLTEIYVILEGEGSIELDGQLFPVKPMTSIMIKPGCRHRAVGKMKILNVAIPAFDPSDEWFD